MDDTVRDLITAACMLVKKTGDACDLEAKYDALAKAVAAYEEEEEEDEEEELDTLVAQWNNTRPQLEQDIDFGGYGDGKTCLYCGSTLKKKKKKAL